MLNDNALAQDTRPHLVGYPRIGPNSLSWVKRLESLGTVAARDDLKARLAESPEGGRREVVWRMAAESAKRVHDVGRAGVVLMGLKYSTLVGGDSENSNLR